MAYINMKNDYHEEFVHLKPEDEGFKINYYIGSEFYENSKCGLKKFLDDKVLTKDYPVLYLKERTYLTDEEDKKMSARYHSDLSHVVWTDNPDVSGVPNYDSKTKSYISREKEFKLTEEVRQKFFGTRLVPGIRKDINEWITNVGKHLAITEVRMVHTHYVGRNDREVIVEVTEIKDLKALRKLREEIHIKEVAKAKAEQEAKEAAEAKLKAEIASAEDLIDRTLYGRETPKDCHFRSRINEYIRSGLITEKFLNARSVFELIPEEKKFQKDYQRIIGILDKSILPNYHTESYLGSLDIMKAQNLAVQMNQKITNEEKRLARAEAAKEIGVGFIARQFR